MDKELARLLAALLGEVADEDPTEAMMQMLSYLVWQAPGHKVVVTDSQMAVVAEVAQGHQHMLLARIDDHLVAKFVDDGKVGEALDDPDLKHDHKFDRRPFDVSRN